MRLRAGGGGARDVWGPSRLPLQKKAARLADGEGGEERPRGKASPLSIFPMRATDTASVQTLGRLQHREATWVAPADLSPSTEEAIWKRSSITASTL